MCPGHILLFGHVKILFLSLLSKSLPIKGRGGQAGRVSGRAENMPRTRRTAAQKKTSLEDPHVVSGDEGNVAPPREPKVSRETKTRLRGLQMSFVKRMYEHAKEFLGRGLERWTTEGVGDCWLLTIMAGWEVKDPALVNAVPDDGQSRQNICTSRRVAIVEFAANAKKNGGFRLLCEMCGLKVDFKNPKDVQRAERAISARLKDWSLPVEALLL